MSLQENIYWILNTPYYKADIVKDMEVLATIIQPVLSVEDTGDFLISRKYMRAWTAVKSASFRDGKSFKCIVDIDNAIPLIEGKRVEVIKTYLGGFISEEVSIHTLKAANIINYGQEITNKKFKEITINPHFVLRMIDQKYVADIIAEEETKIPKWLILLVLGGVGLFIVWQFIFHGQIPFIGGN
jgi:hypothetical protein